MDLLQLEDHDNKGNMSMKSPYALVMVLSLLASIVPTWVHANDEMAPTSLTTQSEVIFTEEVHPWEGAPYEFATKTITLAQPRTGVITMLVEWFTGGFVAEIRNVKAFSATDTVTPINIDDHAGWAGFHDNDNLYRLNLGNQTATTITYEVRADGMNIRGEIYINTLSENASVLTLAGGPGNLWVDTAFTPDQWTNDGTKNATIQATANAQFSFNRAEGPVLANEVAFSGLENAPLTLVASDEKTPEITTLDFYAMQGRSYLDFDTRATDVIVGTNTVLTRAGSGVLAVKASRHVELYNTVWPEDKIIWSKKGSLTYSADSSTPALTVLPLANIVNQNDAVDASVVTNLPVVIRRPIVIPEGQSLSFPKSCKYTFKDTTITAPRIVTSDGENAATNLTLDNTTLFVKGELNTDAHSSIVITHYSAHTDMNVINGSTLSAPKAIAYLGWGGSVNFSVTTGSTLDVKGVSAGRVGTVGGNRTFMLDNSVLKVREEGFKFGHANSNATFKESQIYALTSASIESVSSIQVEGAITLAASKDQMLTVHANFANKIPDVPATFTLGTSEYAGHIKLDGVVRPTIAHINAPLIVVPTLNEVTSGRIAFPTTLVDLPTVSIEVEGKADTVVTIEESSDGKTLVLSFEPTRNEIVLTTGDQTWTDANFAPNWINGTSVNAFFDVPSADTQFSFERMGGAVVATRLFFGGAGTLSLSASNPFPEIGTYDFYAMQGATTVNFNTGSANVIAGTDTTLTQEGTGSLSVDAGRAVTLRNVMWPENKLLLNATGLITYSADLSTPALTALPLVNAHAVNVAINRPLAISDEVGSLRFRSPSTYTFQNTTITTPRIVTSDAENAITNLILDETTLTVRGEINTGAGASVMIAHWPAHTDVNMINKSELLASKAILFLGWAGSADFSATGSTLDVKGVSAGIDGTTGASRTLMLENSVLKMREEGFKFGHANSRATFKDSQIYALLSAPIQSVTPIAVEGAITLAASAGQVLTVHANFANKIAAAPAAFTLGTSEYTGSITLGAAVRPSIAQVNVPIVIVPTREEILAGHIIFPTTLSVKPETAITLEGYTATPTVQIEGVEGVEGAKQLVVTLPLKEITLDGTSKTWRDHGIQPEDNVVFTLTADTTLISNEDIAIKGFAVKSAEGTAYTLTLVGNFELSWLLRLKISDRATVATSATTTIGANAESTILLDNGTLDLRQNMTLNSAISIGIGGGTINVNATVCTLNGSVTGVGILSKMGTGELLIPRAIHATQATAGMTFNAGKTTFGVHGGNEFMGLEEYGTFVINKGAELYLGCRNLYFVQAITKINEGTLTNASYIHFGELHLTGGTLATTGGYSNTEQSILLKRSIRVKGDKTSFITATAKGSADTKQQAVIADTVDIDVENLAGRLVVDQDFILHQLGWPCLLSKTGLGTWEYNATADIPSTITIRAGTLTGTGSFIGAGGVSFADGVTLGGTLAIAKATFGNALTLDVANGAPTITTLTLPEAGTAITLNGTPKVGTLLNWTTDLANIADLITCTNPPKGYELVATATGLALGAAWDIDVGGASQDVKDHITRIAEKDVKISKVQAEHIYIFGLTKIPESDVSFQLTEMTLSADVTKIERVIFTVTTIDGALPTKGEINGVISLNGGTTLDTITTPLELTVVTPTVFTVDANKNIGTLTFMNIPLVQTNGTPFTFIKGVISTQ